MLRVLIADDHPIFRHGVRQILEESGSVKVSGEVALTSHIEAALLADRHDVLLLDVDMPEQGGLAVLPTLRERFPHVPVLMLSFYPERQYAMRALKLGASGYLTKTAAATELVEAITSVAQGRRYMSPSVTDQVIEQLTRGSAARPHERLSEREFQVFVLLAAGEAVGDISRKLELSPKTISTYKHRILEKMELATIADLIRYALDENLTP